MVNDNLLTSKQEIADLLSMSQSTFDRYLRKYPFTMSGVAGVVNRRWRVFRTDVFRWWRHVQDQELRHPEARRMRPEEPPALAEISGR